MFGCSSSIRSNLLKNFHLLDRSTNALILLQTFVQSILHTFHLLYPDTHQLTGLCLSHFPFNRKLSKSSFSFFLQSRHSSALLPVFVNIVKHHSIERINDSLLLVRQHICRSLADQLRSHLNDSVNVCLGRFNACCKRSIFRSKNRKYSRILLC